MRNSLAHGSAWDSASKNLSSSAPQLRSTPVSPQDEPVHLQWEDLYHLPKQDCLGLLLNIALVWVICYNQFWRTFKLNLMFIFFANSWRLHIWWLSFKREDYTPIKYVHASEITVHPISTNLTLGDVSLSLMHLFICWGLFESMHVLTITFRELHFENSLIS